MTDKEKIKHLEDEIKKAKEENDEVYLKYLLRIKEATFNIHAGGTLIFQSGSPAPLPPYKG